MLYGIKVRFWSSGGIGIVFSTGPAQLTGFYLRYQGELLGLLDPQKQNCDPGRKLPPETKRKQYIYVIYCLRLYIYTYVN